MEQAYSGTKRDVALTGEQLADLIAGRSIYLQIGQWDDKVPSFIRVTPPDWRASVDLAVKKIGRQLDENAPTNPHQ